MNEEQSAAYVFAMAVGGLIEAMGMQAKNQESLLNDEAITYDDAAFQKIVNDRGLHHNSVLTIFHGE